MAAKQYDNDVSNSWRQRSGPDFAPGLHADLVMGDDVPDDLSRDPVSHDVVDPEIARWRSTFNGKLFYFTSRESKRIFDEDPELWVSTPHASVNSAALKPVEDEQ